MTMRYILLLLCLVLLNAMDRRGGKQRKRSEDKAVLKVTVMAGDEKIEIDFPTLPIPTCAVPTKFLKIKPFNPSLGRIKPAEVQRSAQLLDQHSPEDLREMIEYAYLMYKDQFDVIIRTKKIETDLSGLIDELFKTFPLFATRRICFYMQNMLLTRNHMEWVKVIHKRYVSDMWDISDKQLAESVANTCDFDEVKSRYEGSFANFLKEWHLDQEQFKSRVELLFPRFDDIDETIDFVAQGLYLQYKNIKDGDHLIRAAIHNYRSHEDVMDILGNIRDKLHIIRYIARKVLALKQISKKRREEKQHALLEIYHLMQPMRIKDSEGTIGRFMENFGIQVPGSPEWHYVRYRLKHLLQQSATDNIFKADNFAQLIVVTFDLLESRIQNAIAHHVPKSISRHLGYLTCGSTPGNLYLYGMIGKVKMDSGVGILVNLECAITNIANVIDNKDFENSCESFIKDCKFYQIFPLTQLEWKQLVAKSFTGSVSTKVSNLIMLKPTSVKSGAKKLDLVIPITETVKEINENMETVKEINENMETVKEINENMETVKEINENTETVKEINEDVYVQEINACESEQTDQPDEIGEKMKGGSHAAEILDTEVKQSDKTKKIPSLEQTEDLPEPVTSNELIHDSEKDNSEEIAMYMAQFEEDMKYHNEMTMKLKRQKFDTSTSVDANVSLSNNHVDFEKCQVVTLCTEDFLTIPAAYALFHFNKVNEIHWEAQHDKSAKYQWLFDPNVIIDNATFIFICQVFGLLPGRSHLTFKEFLNTMYALTFPSAPESDRKCHKNRTVFRFYHHFIINGECCIPPAVGVHPEHKSSDFNHSQVAKALQYAGAFPFFFRKLDKRNIF